MEFLQHLLKSSTNSKGMESGYSACVCYGQPLRIVLLIAINMCNFSIIIQITIFELHFKLGRVSKEYFLHKVGPPIDKAETIIWKFLYLHFSKRVLSGQWHFLRTDLATCFLILQCSQGWQKRNCHLLFYVDINLFFL